MLEEFTRRFCLSKSRFLLVQLNKKYDLYQTFILKIRIKRVLFHFHHLLKETAPKRQFLTVLDEIQAMKANAGKKNISSFKNGVISRMK